MTKEEAISRIQQALSVPNRLEGLVLIDEESADIAIEALQAEPKHGEWIKNTLFGLGVEKYHGFKCSVCNEHTGDITNFCPNCGAKMDGTEE